MTVINDEVFNGEEQISRLKVVDYGVNGVEDIPGEYAVWDGEMRVASVATSDRISCTLVVKLT